jgi:4-hydroxybenzoyl-CoA thioesterase/acyl-CoA thioester hydrolase
MPNAFTMRRRVEFRDTDAAGIAHFSVFFVWMEQAEHAALRQIGLEIVSTENGRKISWPRVSASCDFQSPVRFNDELQIQVRVSEISHRSVTYRIGFTCEGRDIASGQLTAVCCELHEGGQLSAVPIPASIAERLTQMAM